MEIKKKLLTLMSIYVLFLVGCGNGDAALENDPLGLEYQGLEMEKGNHNPYATISSESTSVPSNKFPHTKAIQVQQAKYKFVVQHGQGQNLQVQLPEGITPGQKSPLNNQPSPARPGAEEQQPAPAKPEIVEQQPEAVEQQPEPTQPKTPAQQPEKTPPQQEEGGATQEAAPADGITEIEAKVIELTNVERRNNGLSDLQAHTSLSNVARTKSNDMQQNNYFSHTSPTYGSPFDMMRDFGVSYNAAAENIAQGQQTPEQVVQAWMNSEGHRKNILNGNFTHIGVGYDENGHHWTQMFISQ